MNSLDPDQDQRSVGPDLGPKCLIPIVFLKEFLEKVNLAASSSQFSISPVEESIREDCCCFKPY